MQGVHAACANLDNVNLRWKCMTCVGALKPGEKEELDRRLGMRDWVEESDDSELEEEDKTESEEEEDAKKMDGAVFEKCFTSADDRVWSAVTSSWRVNISRLNLEDPKLTVRMGLHPAIGNREDVLTLIKDKMEAVVVENQKNSEEGEHVKDKDLFQCDLCSFKCEGEAGLSRHGRLHDPGRPYACDQCGLRFMKEGHVMIHARLHSGDRPHKCDQCGEDFVESWRLQLHLAKHDVKRKYECSQCSQRFKTRLALRAHNKKQHVKEEDAKPFPGVSSSLSSRRPRLSSLPNGNQKELKNTNPDVPRSSMTKEFVLDDHLMKPFRLKLKRSTRSWETSDDVIKNPRKKKRRTDSLTDSDSSDSPPGEEESELHQFFPNETVASKKSLPKKKAIEKSFFCHSCDFKSFHRANLTRHIEACHKIKETPNQNAQTYAHGNNASTGAPSDSDDDDDCQYNRHLGDVTSGEEEEFCQQSMVERQRLQLRMSSPVELIVDKLSSPGRSDWSSEKCKTSHLVTTMVNKKKKISLEKKKRPNETYKQILDAVKSKNVKKPKKVQKEYWVVVEGIRNPVRVVEDVIEEEVEEPSLEEEVVSSSDDDLGAHQNPISKTDEERMSWCRVNVEQIDLTEEQKAFAQSVMDFPKGRKADGKANATFSEGQEVIESLEDDLINRVELKTKLEEAVTRRSRENLSYLFETKEVNEMDIEKNEEQGISSIEDSGDENHDVSRMVQDQEEPNKKITSNVGFFMIAQQDEKPSSPDVDETKVDNIAHQVQVHKENKNRTSHSKSDETESESGTIGNRCEVLLENLILTNEDKGYMRSLIRQNNRAGKVTHSPHEDDLFLKASRKKSSERVNSQEELPSSFILETAPSPKQYDSSSSPDLMDPMALFSQNTCSSSAGVRSAGELNSFEAELPKLQCTDLFGLCEFEDQSLVNDLLETDSEDEGKEEEAETLLKPEDLVTMGVGLRSRKPKTAKHQQNAIDPELQNIFLELESLQGSP